LGDYQGTITDTTNGVLLAGSQTLDPFGDPLTGSAGSQFGFHGQYRDASGTIGFQLCACAAGDPTAQVRAAWLCG
jgi:hypothetical protein